MTNAQSDAAWPAASLADIEAQLCAPGARFEMVQQTVAGQQVRTWKNVPPTLAALAQLARAHGDTPFAILEQERVSYADFHRATAALARHFLSLGIGKGDRIGLAMRNLPEWPVAFFAAVSPPPVRAHPGITEFNHEKRSSVAPAVRPTGAAIAALPSTPICTSCGSPL